MHWSYKNTQDVSIGSKTDKREKGEGKKKYPFSSYPFPLFIMSSTIACGAGSLDEDTKRHSRSLDLDSTSRTARRLHQRSVSDGVDMFIPIEPISTSIPMSNSVFSLYKKFGSPGRNRSLNHHCESNKQSQFSKSRASIGSAFSSLSSSRKSCSQRFSCVSSPVNNPGIL